MCAVVVSVLLFLLMAGLNWDVLCNGVGDAGFLLNSSLSYGCMGTFELSASTACKDMFISFEYLHQCLCDAHSRH